MTFDLLHPAFGFTVRNFILLYSSSRCVCESASKLDVVLFVLASIICVFQQAGISVFVIWPQLLTLIKQSTHRELNGKLERAEQWNIRQTSIFDFTGAKEAKRCTPKSKHNRKTLNSSQMFTFLYCARRRFFISNDWVFTEWTNIQQSILRDSPPDTRLGRSDGSWKKRTQLRHEGKFNKVKWNSQPTHIVLTSGGAAKPRSLRKHPDQKQWTLWNTHVAKPPAGGTGASSRSGEARSTRSSCRNERWMEVV